MKFKDGMDLGRMDVTIGASSLLAPGLSSSLGSSKACGP